MSGIDAHEALSAVYASLAELKAIVYQKALTAAPDLVNPIEKALRAENLFYLNPVENSTVLVPALLELDTFCLGLVLLTVGHATLHRRLLWLVLFTCITIVMEQVLIRSGTHCHSEALFMVSQCSSANSVAVYVSGLYVCSLASVRLQLHPIARPFATAILFCCFMLPYALQGAAQGWWSYGPSTEEAGLALSRGPMWTFRDASATALLPTPAVEPHLTLR